jgi:hypothetical protein
MRTGVEAGGSAIRNRGLLTSVIEVWTWVEIWPGWARLQNTFSTEGPQLVCGDWFGAIELSQLRRIWVGEYFKLWAKGMLSWGVRGEH